MKLGNVVMALVSLFVVLFSLVVLLIVFAGYKSVDEIAHGALVQSASGTYTFEQLIVAKHAQDGAAWERSGLAIWAVALVVLPLTFGVRSHSFGKHTILPDRLVIAAGSVLFGLGSAALWIGEAKRCLIGVDVSGSMNFDSYLQIAELRRSFESFGSTIFVAAVIYFGLFALYYHGGRHPFFHSTAKSTAVS
jgi:hypothetical protein